MSELLKSLQEAILTIDEATALRVTQELLVSGTEPEEILEAFIRTCRALSPAIEAVVTNHLETNRPVLLEGDYLLPELAARYGESTQPSYRN